MLWATKGRLGTKRVALAHAELGRKGRHTPGLEGVAWTSTPSATGLRVRHKPPFI